MKRLQLDLPPGTKLTIEVPSGPDSPDHPTECERDVLAVVRAAGRPLTGPQIRSALAAAGKIHGDSTVSRALPRMVRTKTLEKCGKKGGYGIPKKT